MAIGKEQLILFSAEQDNILPLTSACNVKCVFCSHRQNPAGVQVYGTGHRSLTDIELTLDLLDPEQKIVIGESVTRIMEGEPFLHPDVCVILRLIRERFPETTIQITTNGTLLTTAILDLLKNLGRIELYLSLNSVTAEGRQLLMGDDGVVVRQALEGLKERGIRYQGSIVAMPWLVGWADMEQTVASLAMNGAETVRIFMPGFTDLAPAELRFPPDLPEELQTWVKEMQVRYQIPLTLEPTFVSELNAVVEGVIAGSQAEKAGVEPGDEILTIGGEAPFSRVDAFYRLARGGRSALRIRRSGEEKLLTLDKRRGERSGLVFAYDLHPDIYQTVLRLISRKGAKNVLLLCSTLARPLLEILARRVEEELTGRKVTAAAVPNRFFGGSIMAGGLLVIQDFLDCWAEMADHNYDLIVVPGIFLDPWGMDLTGRPIGELEKILGVPVEIIEI